MASRQQAAQLSPRAAEIEAEAARVDVEAQLVARLTRLMQTVMGDADDPDVINEMRAALTATFDRVIFEPGWEVTEGATPESAPVISGPAELCPVLRSDLLAAGGGNSFARGASPPGTRDRRAPRSRTWAADPCAGGPRPRRDAARGRRAQT